jgi:hypothetical protein
MSVYALIENAQPASGCRTLLGTNCNKQRSNATAPHTRRKCPSGMAAASPIAGKTNALSLPLMCCWVGERGSARRCRMAASWNKEQAELLRRIALAGGKYRADECRGPALEALVETGFVRFQGSNGVVLTDAGVARARQLRSRRPY